MSYTRFIAYGTIKKPIPQKLKDKWPEIKLKVNRLLDFAVIINPGKPYEEKPSIKFENDYVSFNLNLAIPNPLPQQVIDNLPQIRQSIRWLMGFVDEEEFGGKATYHVCHHDEAGVPCGKEQEI